MPVPSELSAQDYEVRTSAVHTAVPLPKPAPGDIGPRQRFRIPFNQPFITGEELESIAQSFASGHFCADGAFTSLCQRYLEERFAARRILLTTSCTAALEMAALLLDVGPEDEIILPSYTFVSTANAFLLRGARMVFVDIRPDTLNIDEALISAAVTKRTKAIVPVHYAGVACEMDAICAMASKRGIHVVEDAAQGLDARYSGRYLGTIGDLGTYSFHETKNAICGEGGSLVINRPLFEDRAEFIREKGTNRSNFSRGKVDKYTWIDIGSSYALSDVLAAFLWGQLHSLDAIREMRATAFGRYYEALRPLQDRGLLRLPVVPSTCEPNYHMFYVLLDQRFERGAVIKQLQRRGIQAVFHFVPLHLSPMGARLGCISGTLPVTEDVSRRLLRLPFFCSLSESDIDAVAIALWEILSA